MVHDPASSQAAPADELVMPLDASWRLANGMRSQDVAQGPVPFPDEVATLRVGYQPIGDQSGIFDVCGNFFTPVVVNSRVLVDGPILVLRLETSGNTALQHSVGTDPLEESRERYSFSLLDSAGCQVHHRPGALTENLAVILTAERLRRMLDGSRVPGPVQRFLDGNMGNFGATPLLSTAMRRAAEQIRANPYTDGMGALYRQGRVCDMLAEALVDLAGIDENANRALGADKRKAMVVRDQLMSDLANPPSVEVLAYQVGLSQRRLNEVFRDTFGATVFEWLVVQRLDLSRDLLRDGNLPIKEIAHRLGYSHQNNFSKAFAQRFGGPPGSFRKAPR